MFAQIRSFWAPLFSLSLLVLASGLFSTFSSLRIEHEGFSANSIGIITASLYAGILIGSLLLPRPIERKGHARSFIVFASITTLLILAQGLWIHPFYWSSLRFITGICSAGIFIVIESWLLMKSAPSMRSRILSLYLTTIYASLALGQFLINLSDPLSIYPFCIAAGLSAVAVLPIALQVSASPKMESAPPLSLSQFFRLSPLGFLGGIIAGMLLATIYGLVPVYGKNLGLEVSEIATLMAVIIFGGLIFQFPISHWADKGSRRAALNTSCFCTSICGMAIPFFESSSLLFLFAWLFGGFAFTIYPLSMAYVCAKIDTNQIVAATGGFVLSYGIGAIAGPLIAPFAMHCIGSVGLFYFIALITFFLGLFGLKKASLK